MVRQLECSVAAGVGESARASLAIRLQLRAGAAIVEEDEAVDTFALRWVERAKLLLLLV